MSVGKSRMDVNVKKGIPFNVSNILWQSSVYPLKFKQLSIDCIGQDSNLQGINECFSIAQFTKSHSVL